MQAKDIRFTLYLLWTISQLCRIKEKKIIKKQRWFYYFIIEYKGNFYIKKREKKDIWEGLHEFVMIESEQKSSPKKLIQFNKLFSDTFQILKMNKISKVYKQQLTHQTIHAVFIHLESQKNINLPPYITTSKKNLSKLAFPKIINQFLNDSLILHSWEIVHNK